MNKEQRIAETEKRIDHVYDLYCKHQDMIEDDLVTMAAKELDVCEATIHNYLTTLRSRGLIVEDVNYKYGRFGEWKYQGYDRVRELNDWYNRDWY